MPTVPDPADQTGASYGNTRDAFDGREAAAGYANQFRTRRDARARRALLEALAPVPAGASVIDLPCGSGRLLSLLAEKRYVITAADSSAHMVSKARETWEEQRGTAEGEVRFDVQDVMSTTYADGEFDVVICNRLLHHYSEAATRVAALRELGRICRGQVIAFFFNASTLGGMRFRARRALRIEKPTSHNVIPARQMTADAAAAGLRPKRYVATRGAFGKECFAVLVHANGP
jgi:2-polyprenyl-3-methyl-5-hydroxy-6-metoxy-1,4-benzoquinol methylase